jgi:hypothetical protein
MIVVLSVAATGIVAGFLIGGSLRNFERVRVHWWAVAFVGLVLQAAPVGRWLDDDAVLASLIVSYGLLVAFMWVNRRLPAAPLLLTGLALNMLVIAVNGGMPVGEAAIRTTGNASGSLPASIDDGKHHLMSSADVLTPLADVIGLPPPISIVLSIGDVVLYSGIAVFTVIVMRGRFAENRRPPAWIQMYRGKHLPSQRRLPRRSRPGREPRLAAASSGTSR